LSSFSHKSPPPTRHSRFTVRPFSDFFDVDLFPLSLLVPPQIPPKQFNAKEIPISGKPLSLLDGFLALCKIQCFFSPLRFKKSPQPTYVSSKGTDRKFLTHTSAYPLVWVLPVTLVFESPLSGPWFFFPEKAHFWSRKCSPPFPLRRITYFFSFFSCFLNPFIFPFFSWF